MLRRVQSNKMTETSKSPPTLKPRHLSNEPITKRLESRTVVEPEHLRIVYNVRQEEKLVLLTTIREALGVTCRSFPDTRGQGHKQLVTKSISAGVGQDQLIALEPILPQDCEDEVELVVTLIS